MHPWVLRRTNQGVGKSGLDFSRKRIALAQRDIEPFDYSKGFDVAQGFNNFGAREGTEASDMNNTDL